MDAVIFDFDGLIADTEWPEFVTWGAEFQRHGQTLLLEDWVKCVGTSSDVWSVEAHLQALAGPVDLNEVRARRHAHMGRLMTDLEPMPGLLALLDDLDRAGVPVGVASSSVSDWVVGHLDRLGLSPRFPVVVTRGELPAKPAPDLYLRACALLSANPRRSVALEDSVNGIRAAKAAGMASVAVPNRVTQVLDFSLADVVVPSLEAVTAATLSSLIA